MKRRLNIRAYVKEVGFRIFLSKAIRKCFYESNSKLAWKINEIKENIITLYLDKFFRTAKKSYNDIETTIVNDLVPENPIWIMWWQGEQEAPEIVKCCINSVRMHRKIVLCL